ncbi:MAG: hypothetical protein HC925_01145 [Coleofasciculaceae cyanobacterium SM2_3_26]|nr:hypothetical protein [Coleofasciculaceae cyanobacterium SM2_3_26]
MAEVGILATGEQVELIAGQILQKSHIYSKVRSPLRLAGSRDGRYLVDRSPQFSSI